MSVINLHLGDCEKAMAQMTENQYDLAIVDPPYGIGASKMTMGSGKHKFDKNKSWDNNIPNKTYFDLLSNKSTNQIIWGGNYFTEYLSPTPNWVIWDKRNPNLSFAEGEMAWMSFGNNLRIFKHLSTQFDVGGKNHPTQKPIKLYKWLLTNYAKQGDKILDTHGGSMSIAIACGELGFDLDLWELDEDYFDKGVERVQTHFKQQSMFQEKPIINVIK